MPLAGSYPEVACPLILISLAAGNYSYHSTAVDLSHRNYAGKGIFSSRLVISECAQISEPSTFEIRLILRINSIGSAPERGQSDPQ